MLPGQGMARPGQGSTRGRRCQAMAKWRLTRSQWRWTLGKHGAMDHDTILEARLAVFLRVEPRADVLITKQACQTTARFFMIAQHNLSDLK